MERELFVEAEAQGKSVLRSQTVRGFGEMLGQVAAAVRSASTLKSNILAMVAGSLRFA